MSETPHLLFVDDEERVLNAIRRHFLDEHYDIRTATSGRLALDMLEQSPSEVIVSDFRMPEMNGGEFLREVSHRWPETVRIVLSGYADISAVISAVNDGAIFKFVTKPWQENELKDAVREGVEKYRSMLQMRELAEQTLFESEELLQQTRRSLSGSLDAEPRPHLELIRDAFQCAPAPILVLDSNGRLLELNTQARLALGLDDEFDPNADSVLIVPPELCGDAINALHGIPLSESHYMLNNQGIRWRGKFATFLDERGLIRVVVVLHEI